MAIVPQDDYPAQTTAGDPGYPHGKAKNITTPGDGTGFPWIAPVVNDMLGHHQALLDEAGITPSGVPDEVGASDYVDSLLRIVNRKRDAAMVSNMRVSVSSSPDSVHAFAVGLYKDYGGAVGRSTMHVAVCDGGKIKYSHDLFRTGVSLSAGSSYAGTFRSVTYMRNVDRFVAAGDAGEIQSWAPVGAWTSRKSDATFDFARVLYEHSLTMAVAVGGNGTDGKIFTSTDGITWTARTVPAGVSDIFDLVWDGSRFVAVGEKTGTGECVVISSTDGITWVEDYASTTPTSYAQVTYHAAQGAYFACTATKIYKSTDRATWTEVYTHTGGATGSEIYALFSFGEVVAAILYPVNGPGSAFSVASVDGASGTWVFSGGPPGVLSSKLKTAGLAYVKDGSTDAYFLWFGRGDDTLMFSDIEARASGF